MPEKNWIITPSQPRTLRSTFLSRMKARSTIFFNFTSLLAVFTSRQEFAIEIEENFIFSFVVCFTWCLVYSRKSTCSLLMVESFHSHLLSRHSTFGEWRAKHSTAARARLSHDTVVIVVVARSNFFFIYTHAKMFVSAQEKWKCTYNVKTDIAVAVRSILSRSRQIYLCCTR